MTKKAFRVESGVDAGGFNVSNVAVPRDGNLTDAVNVQYFIRENTVQPFDATRDYNKDFAVTYENRIWIAKVDVTAGPFDSNEWRSLRTDPKWEVITGTPDAGRNLNSGDYLSAYSVNTELTFNLPSNPVVGDTIVIKDEGMYCNLNKIVVKAPAKPIQGNKTEELFTIPGSMKTFIYSNTDSGRWVVHTSVDKIEAKIVVSTGQPNQMASGDINYRRSSTGHIVLQLPKYAADGDVISTHDLDNLTPVNGATLQVHPDSGHFIEENGKTSETTNTSNFGNFVFTNTGGQKIWKIWEGDILSRWRQIASDYTAVPRDKIMVVGGNGTVAVTLPSDAQTGDSVIMSNFYRVDGVVAKVQVATGSGHKIVGDLSQFKFPKFSNIKDLDANPLTDSITLTGDNYGAVVELFYNKTTKHWMASSVQLRTEHVDENYRDRPGVAPLAAQSEVNKNHEDNPRDDMIVTPKTLANKTSTETRRGISRIATAAELQVPTSGNHLNDVIVTPKRLNERQATEEIRGVAEVATQAEANTSTNDTHIVTPKKLDARRAAYNLAGVVKLVAVSGAPSSSRSNPGTGVYDWSNAVHQEPFVITPKTLNEAQATENSRGVGYVATQSEANTQGNTTSDAVFITPKKLDARRANESLAGIAEIATQAETNTGTDDVRIVTPKKLNDRRSTETLHGLAAIATTAEVNAGNDDTKFITPLKNKQWLSQDHFVSNLASGITHSSNLWAGVNLDIVPATETQRGTLRTATQAEANAQGSATLDNVMITPKKLDARRSTENMIGLARIGTQAEVNAGALDIVFVSPKKLEQYIHVSPDATSNEGRNGTVKTSPLARCFVGNNTAGSTQAVDAYDHFPNAVSPRGLNFALQNFLPKNAKAVDADKLDGLDSLQFLRSDVSGTLTGNLSVTGSVTSTLNHRSGYFTIAPFSAAYGQDYKCEIYFKEKDSGGAVENYGLVITATNRVANPAVSKPLNIWLDGNKVYHQGFRPTPAEIGAYTKAEADSKFVDAAGDTMTGKLNVTTIGFTGGDANKWSLSTHSNGNFEINNGTQNTAKMYISQNGDAFTRASMTSTAFKVGSTVVIETDAKINWNKLKGIPSATTAQQGIVKLNNTLDSNTQTEAATANTIRILKEMIDEKAGITGAIMNDLKIRNWIRIGNVILRPNPDNKTLDFIWTDEPM